MAEFSQVEHQVICCRRYTKLGLFRKNPEKIKILENYSPNLRVKSKKNPQKVRNSGKKDVELFLLLLYTHCVHFIVANIEMLVVCGVDRGTLYDVIKE